MENKRLFNIFIIVFIDLLGFGLILPLLPFYADQYGAAPLVVGLLTAIYAAAQLVGAPFLGRLSDRFGRRPILLISIFGTFLGFLLFGIAEPLGEVISPSLSIPINTLILSILFSVVPWMVSQVGIYLSPRLISLISLRKKIVPVA